jgi:septal ring factor EnvC (AmiA/AmiB activator)
MRGAREEKPKRSVGKEDESLKIKRLGFFHQKVKKTLTTTKLAKAKRQSERDRAHAQERERERERERAADPNQPPPT